jgi:hypothetical protein
VTEAVIEDVPGRKMPPMARTSLDTPGPRGNAASGRQHEAVDVETELRVEVEDGAWPPSITPGAAAVLLRILLKAADRRARAETGHRDQGAWPLAS